MSMVGVQVHSGGGPWHALPNVAQLGPRQRRARQKTIAKAPPKTMVDEQACVRSPMSFRTAPCAPRWRHELCNLLKAKWSSEIALERWGALIERIAQR